MRPPKELGVNNGQTVVNLFSLDLLLGLQDRVIYPTELAVTPRSLQDTILVKIYLLWLYDLMLRSKSCR